MNKRTGLLALLVLVPGCGPMELLLLSSPLLLTIVLIFLGRKLAAPRKGP